GELEEAGGGEMPLLGIVEVHRSPGADLVAPETEPVVAEASPGPAAGGGIKPVRQEEVRVVTVPSEIDRLDEDVTETEARLRRERRDLDFVLDERRSDLHAIPGPENGPRGVPHEVEPGDARGDRIGLAGTGSEDDVAVLVGDLVGEVIGEPG